MEIAFDVAKDAINREKHGVSLARAAELQNVIVIADNRFTDERRYRLYGLLDGRPIAWLPWCATASFGPSACGVRIERNMSVMSPSDTLHLDDDNPEWTRADFADARPINHFPDLAAAFPATRGAQRAPTKRQVTLRLDEDIVERFRATGRG